MLFEFFDRTGFLRTAVKEYVEFYNQERPHQGLDNELVTEITEKYEFDAPVKSKERLGWLLNYYYR
jgi:ABC-type microcin C transport system permease subunit YejB